MIELLQGYTLKSLPKHWSIYRSKSCSCELWHPLDWQVIEIGQPLIFRPAFARQLSPSYFDFSPVITMYRIIVDDSYTEEQNMERVFHNTYRGFAAKDVKIIKKEKGQFRDRHSLFTWVSFNKEKVTWEGMVLYQTLAKSLWYADASGRKEDMEKNQEILRTVIASLRTYVS